MSIVDAAMVDVELARLGARLSEARTRRQRRALVARMANLYAALSAAGY